MTAAATEATCAAIRCVRVQLAHSECAGGKDGAIGSTADTTVVIFGQTPLPPFLWTEPSHRLNTSPSSPAARSVTAESPV